MKTAFFLCLASIFSISMRGLAIVNGEPAGSHAFEAVGALKVASEPTVSCTATLIEDRWIVTAAHCTFASIGSEEEGGELLDPSQYEFRLGNDFQKPIFKSVLKRWVRIETNDQSDIDIAFGELRYPVSSTGITVKPLRSRSQVWDKTDFQAEYLHIGYGVHAAFSKISSPLTDKRQLARFSVTSAKGNALLNIFADLKVIQNYIRSFHPNINEEEEPIESILKNADLVEGYSIHAWDARGRTNVAKIERPPGGWQDTCFGDSGGPLLRKIDGKMQIIGIVSAGINRTCEALGTKFTTFGPKVQELMKTIGLTNQ